MIVGETREVRKLLVNELRGQHGMRRFHGIGSGEIVILTRVDYYSGVPVNNAGEILVDERALHVNVAE